MTIRDIAQLSGVSIATISRILNNKTQGISEETRARVQKVIDDNNYVAYAKVRNKILADNHTIAVILPTLQNLYYTAFTQALQQTAAEHEFKLQLFVTNNNLDKEQGILSDCLLEKVSGIVIVSPCSDVSAVLAAAREQSIAAILADFEGEAQIYPTVHRDMFEIAKECTALMYERGANRVALLCSGACDTLLRTAMIRGYKESVKSNSRSGNGARVVTSDNVERELDILFDAGVDALLCESPQFAMQAYSLSAKRMLQIPQDISVMSLEDNDITYLLSPALAAHRTDPKEMAQLCLSSIVAQTKHIPPPFLTQRLKGELMLWRSLFHRRDNAPKIVVVGTLNIDTVIKVPTVPHPGQTMMAEEVQIWPGGKGANQAFGVSRFGAKAYMIGCLGNDRYGRRIHETLDEEGVIMSGVKYNDDILTGTAFVQLYNDGSNSIVVNSGANKLLTPEYVLQNEQYLNGAAYCLVQMEINYDAVCTLSDLCRKKQVPMVLKPAPARELCDDITNGLYLLVPNREEMSLLCPHVDSVEDQAMFFIKKGVQNVIVTLAEQGCVWLTAEQILYFEAPKCNCVDDTGASDVFISCLCAVLAHGAPFEKAIKTSLYAASKSVTQEGVQNSIPQREELENLN